MNTPPGNHNRYVLATAAYNEERYIENLIKSVVAQIHRPERWIIVSDGSTDRTDEIALSYSRTYPFIRLYRITEEHARNFAAQVHAINAGFAQLWNLEFDFIGNLDADITLEPDYFSRLIGYFNRDPNLGLAGGYICEEKNGHFQPRYANSTRSVAHAVQLFRRECLDGIGRGYTPLPYGGPDWYAEIRALMCGWRVEAFRDLPVFHHRPTCQAEGLIKSVSRMGRMDYAMGSHPLFELVKMVRRVRSKPHVLRAAMRFWFFMRAYCQREERPVPADVVRFLRRQQMSRLRDSLRMPRARLSGSSQSGASTRPGEREFHSSSLRP